MNRRASRVFWVAGALVVASVVAACGSKPARPTRSAYPARSHGSTAAADRPTYGETYVVARGDTLFSIAFRNQLDYHDIADWNGIGRDYAIRPGQVLRLTAPDGVRLTIPREEPKSSATSKPVLAGPANGPDSTRPMRPAPASTLLLGSGQWEWPTRGKLIRAFDGSSNKGIDIGGDVGQIVIASRPGKVVYSGSALKGYGELIIVKHDEDVLSAYGYNRRRLVEEGDMVVGGQPIAELGTGPEQKPLLHFEIRDHGRPVDPKPLLPPR